jgi:guanylate kinase
MAQQLDEDEREHRETLRKLYGWGRPDNADLIELSEWDYGFNVFEKFPDGKERMIFVTSNEAAELSALLQAKRAKEYHERRERMTSEERRIDDLNGELLLLQLAQINRELDG